MCGVCVYVSLSVFVCASSFCVFVRVYMWVNVIQLVFIHMYTFVKFTCGHNAYGNEDIQIQYISGGIVLSTTIKQNGLGLIIIADMIVSDQCGIAASKGYQIIIVYKEKELIIPLYKTIDVALQHTTSRHDDHLFIFKTQQCTYRQHVHFNNIDIDFSIHKSCIAKTRHIVENELVI